MKNIIRTLFLVVTIIQTSCSNDTKKLAQLQEINDSIQKAFAPDKRVAIYDIKPELKNGIYVLSGQTNQPKAKELLLQKLKQLDIDFQDSISILPDATVGNLQFAIVNNSVANIRSQPKHSAELGTQALLGTSLNVLKIEGSFYRVQTPDQYISWVDHGGVQLMDKKTFEDWENATKIIYTQTAGYVYQSDKKDVAIVSDIVLGAQLKLLEEDKNFYKIAYPDNRVGYVVKSEASVYNNWITNLKPSKQLVEYYAKSLMGFPYLWGGTSTKGMDCSGFTKTVYLMNGMVIPRDASQQINAGKIIDPNFNFEGLEKGDLMFFGTKAEGNKKQRVTHVGIWLGNAKGEFIHAAKQVRLSSIYPDAEHYDPANTKRYLGSRRYLNVDDPMIINLKKSYTKNKVLP